MSLTSYLIDPSRVEEVIGMGLMETLSNAPNQQAVLTCLKGSYSGEWVRAHQVAEETELRTDQFRRAANALAGKGHLEKKSEDTRIPFLPRVGVLAEGKKEQLLRENDVPKEEWDETWRRWKKLAEEEGYWFPSTKVWFRWIPEKLN